ncbi:hypothetical protein N7488_005872 [Penicillium malachiteum]|nr:hypothetical protein N7488_005872 [Penicillium malachiteum]
MIAPPIFEVSPPPYPERHAHLFKDYQIPRTPYFNPDKATLFATVDAMVRDLIKILEENDVLNATYIFYTTDYGFHIAQHRLAPGKQCGYETDIHIPMLVRGPGVAAGEVYDGVTSHTDVAPMIMKLAGAEQRGDFDGTPFPVTNNDLDAGDHDHTHEHVNIEHWGVASPEGKYGKYGDHNRFGNKTGTATSRNTYKGLRLQSDALSLYYSVWCHAYNGQHDPFQINNFMENGVVSMISTHEIGDRPLEEVVNRLDALLMVLKTCKTHSCVKPWERLHPKGDVKSLKDALMPGFDAFYSGQPKVSFQAARWATSKSWRAHMMFICLLMRHTLDTTIEMSFELRRSLL